MENLESKLEDEGNSGEESSSEGENVSRKTILEQRAEVIIGLIKNGAESQTEIARTMGLSINVIRYQAKISGIELPKGKRGVKPKGRLIDIDELIEKGWKLLDIGQKIGLTHQAVRHYIIRSGQYDNWVRKRIENTGINSGDKYFGGVNKLHVLQSSFLSSIKERTRQLAENKDFATQKAVEYLHSYKFSKENSYSFSRLHNIFKKYENALKKGEKLTLDELGKVENIWSGGVGRILERVGLEPLFGKRETKVQYYREKNEATNRGFYSDFSGKDIAYFLDLPAWVPVMRFSQKEKRRSIKNRGIKLFGFGLGGVLLTYKLASEIYEAKDAGFDTEEIRELTETKSEVVDYTLSHRKEIEPKIINGLKILYYGSVVRKPYVTSEMKKSLDKE
ncbi:MAG: hypothetical protein Q7S27_03015 [Nanoarchaeota archaeon]|nr:hypothetical protein [Nanoarchaeota archaeon]